MALGKKIIEWNYVDQVKGMSTSGQIADAGFSPVTDGMNLSTNPGVMFNPPAQIDASAGVTGAMIASCEDPTGNYDRLYTSSTTIAGGDGRFFSLSAGVITQRGSTDSSHGYVFGKTDMIAFDGEAYITSATDLVRWSSIGSSNTFNTSFFAFNDAFAPHPALTFNNFAYYGDGNQLLRQSAAAATPSAILTLPASWVIVALGIDPGSGSMLISVIGQINLSDSINSGCRIGFYDGFSNQVSRYVQVDDMVTAFAPTEGSLYCSYGQNLGLWNGSGITFLRHMALNFDYTELMYKQHFTSIGSTLLFVERARIIAYGPVRQKGDNVFYPVLTNTIDDIDVDLSHIASIGSNNVSMAYDTNQFDIFNMFDVTATNQEFWSNNYNFDDELWVRRARIVYKNKVPDGQSPGNLVIYDQDGIVTETADNGFYPLLNSKGFPSAFKDIDNINLRLKELTFGLLLNQGGGPSVDGSATTGTNAGSTNTISFTHTVAAGLDNSLVLVMVASPQNTNPTGLLNGNSMDQHIFSFGGYLCTLLYGVPIAGSNAIELDFAISSNHIGYTAVTVKDAGAPTGFAGNSSDTQFPSVSLTSALADSLYFEFFMTTAGITVTTPGGQTELSNVGISSVVYQASYKQGVNSGTTAMTVGMNTDATMQINGFVIPPVSGGINPGIQRVIFYGDPANITGTTN